ncbi:MAG: hypothetical protein J6K29_01045 [Clostridia bacterium]|nr:hypothetical protein [Clostridia bacterium]
MERSVNSALFRRDRLKRLNREARFNGKPFDGQSNGGSALPAHGYRADARDAKGNGRAATFRCLNAPLKCTAASPHEQRRTPMTRKGGYIE